MPEGAHVVAAKGFLAKIEEAILFPLMTLLMAVAVLVFLWGMYQYVLNSDEQNARETARMHMLAGIIGLVVMVSAYAILKIVANTFGVDVPSV